MSNDIKIGDTVQIKSDWPKMIVSKIGDLNGQQTAWCSWLDTTNHQVEGTFPLVALKPVKARTRIRTKSVRGI